VDIDPLPEAICALPSIYNRPIPPPLARIRLPVVPLSEIQAHDTLTRRVIDRVVARQAS
jgi:hypothetical protein